ncbi:MAG: gliding motility-associated C-terminal domain-containing protein [Bacteroidales bacterium]|nr:gliding motility-associated C-terminal domain-containing protein [Bacteroidales bacterium]
MKKILSLAVFLVLTMASLPLVGQNLVIVRMDASTDGTVVEYSTEMSSLVIRDDDSQGGGAPEEGFPMRGVDRILTVSGVCAEPYRLAFRILENNISCLDTLYVYDGADTSSDRLIAKINSADSYYAEDNYVIILPDNSTNMLTLRFVTDPYTDTNRTNLPCAKNGPSKGFAIQILCQEPCETVVPVIDSMFYRTRNGVIYDSAFLQEVFEYDTLFANPDDRTSEILSIDTQSFIGANLCIGDGVIFHGHGEYSYRYHYYTPSDSTSMFYWDLANQGDSVVGVGATTVVYDEYQSTGCYDISLRIVDVFGCTSDVYTSVRVRTAMNPIKTIYTLANRCNNDSLMVNMGYGGENATLTLARIESDSVVSKINEVRTFIPDGGTSASSGCNAPYYEAPVEFTEFPNNRSITSGKDICSICINMEHSFMGDIAISIVCPTGQEAFMKYGNYTPNAPSQSIPGAGYGSGTFLGFPLGFSGSSHSDSQFDGSPTCDSLKNPFGVGLDYCFSRNADYTLVTGNTADYAEQVGNPHPAGNFYIVTTGQYVDNLHVDFPVIPNYFQNHGGQSGGSGNISTKRPSNHEDKTDYYMPYTDFSELEGCPLNGLWKIRVYDDWGADNGWIFNWSMDICNVSENDCIYQVGIDSLVWRPDPDPQYHDYELGHYRGAVVHMESPTVSYISSPDTAGTFPIQVFVYDAFGCVWDTATRITTFWSPLPDLGPDTALCGVESILLDASDRHSDSLGFTYVWEPYGQNTDTISTQTWTNGTTRYVVSARNLQNGALCETRDTINVSLLRQPLPSVVPSPFTFEGCDPLTLEFENQSVDADSHMWVFGDGNTSTLANPTHTYAAGLYDFKYYAISADGCIDSIISPQSIAVYPAPKASFAWSPTYPSVLQPVVTLDNRTEPKSEYNKYFWEVQYNVDNPISVETMTDEYPTFDFSQYNTGDPSGSYTIRLIVRTDNPAPSGNVVYCRDTTENTILLVNDYLQFPNVVSPNGDGINDRFVIQNLINGLGFPVNSLYIYNEWGVCVFHKENIASDEDFWDPSDVPAGSYFYRFSARGYNGNIEHNGVIEVVK